MPSLGYYHPQLVHFAIVLCGLGVAFRLASFLKRLAWTGPTGTTLLIAGAVISFFTAQSGHQAHGPIERIPGAAEAVQEHEEWGDRTRNIFLSVGVLELVALGMGPRKVGTALRAASALVGIGGLAALYETGEHGGALVYNYGGGPGLRSGDPADLTRLLVAGLYSRAQADRASGDREGAARLTDELARRMPNDPAVKLLVIESQFKDRGDVAGAVAALRQFDPGDDRRGKFRKAFLMADAFQAGGMKDSARAVLEALKKEVPQAAERIDQALRDLGKTP